MQVQILKEADTGYEEIEHGLGLRFKDEVQRHVQLIREHPALPRLRNKSYRRVNLRRFPFYIAYVLKDETIYVVAIAHSKREPNYWKERS